MGENVLKHLITSISALTLIEKLQALVKEHGNLQVFDTSDLGDFPISLDYIDVKEASETILEVGDFREVHQYPKRIVI